MAQADKKVRAEMAKQVRLLLGEGMIDLEVDPDHVTLGIDLAFERFRQRSSNAVEETYGFLEIQPETNEYTLPEEVKAVSELYRRGVAGLSTGGGSYIDPFSLAYTNLYLLRSGDQGGLATYDFFSQYQETVGRMFGLYLNYTYEPTSRKLTLMRKPTNHETILMKIQLERSEKLLWLDEFAKPWLRDYAVAKIKLMMAEARSLFSQIPGPLGGTTLNGADLKADAQADLERLETEITNYVAGDTPMSFVIG